MDAGEYEAIKAACDVSDEHDTHWVGFWRQHCRALLAAVERLTEENYYLAHDPHSDLQGARAEVVRLTAERDELLATKVAFQATPKQWSTAQAPTMEALVASAWQVATEQKYAKLLAERDALRAGLAPFAEYAGIVWGGAHEHNPIGDACPPAVLLTTEDQWKSAKPLPTIGDCRRAAALLAGKAVPRAE